MIARLTSAARRLQLLAIVYLIALGRALWPHANVGCQGEGCNGGRRPERCNCHLRNAWATTSDPASHRPPSRAQAPAPARVGPQCWDMPHRAERDATSSVMRLVESGERPAPHRQMTAEMWDDAAQALPMRWRDWVISMVVVALAFALAGYMSGGAA